MDKHAEKPQNSQNFPPVIAVLGHVDHGKTTLLDAIRKSSIAEREHGGITQKIGASRVEIDYEGKKRDLTFIDTPGHEAFSNMRSRGAQVADVILLIVSAADGVMPQTKESIALLKGASVPYIVVLTKADLDTAQPEKVKQQLLKEEIMLEGMGGDVPVIQVSAKTNLNIKELLDLILLVNDLHKTGKTVSPTAPLSAIVIESRLDNKVGPRATVVVKNGTLKLREEYSVEGQTVRIRTILDDQGKQQKEATVGDAVEIFGFVKVPPVGGIMTTVADAKVKEEEKTESLAREMVYAKKEETHSLSIILVADTQGSLEAILYSLPPEATIVSKKTGEITEADILLAKSTESIVLGFNTKLKPDVAKLAITEKVLARNYTIIYEMLDEIRDVLEGKRLALLENIYGTAQILASFPYEKTVVLGIKVLDGRIARNDKVRLMRGEEAVGEASVTSLRHGKETVSKIEKNQEGGIILTPALDFQMGDVVLSHS